MAKVGDVVNFNNGDGVVRAVVVRDNTDPDDDSRVFLWAPERGSGHVTLEKGDGTGVPRRSPADYDEGGGGGLTWHELSDEEVDE